MVRIAVALMLAALSVQASAREPINLHLGQWSWHFNRTVAWNETNDLIAIEYRNVFVGSFVNSYGDRSYTAAYRLPYAMGPLDLGIKLGAVYGYQDNLVWWKEGNVAPFVLLDAALPITEHAAIVSHFLPGGFVSLGARFTF